MSEYTAFEHLFDPVIILNQKKEILYFNNQSSMFFKLPPRILKQKKMISQICESVDLDLEDWLDKALLSYDVLISPEIKLHLLHEPETEYFTIMKLIPVISEEVIQFALVFHDKTVETNLHLKYRDQLDELKKTHGQILQADKLTTLGELTANISHEINNPLTIAAGHSEIIRDLLKSPSPMSKINFIQSANQTVIDSLERVNQIIKNMKDFLYQSEDKKEYCDLISLIDSATEWISPTASKHKISIIKNLQSNSVALVNRIKIEQVLINLIKNSIDAINSANIQNGMITITLGKSDTDQQTYIDILDNGPGMSEQMKKNLFKPFQSTKDSGHGTGLGLSICAKIIEAHRGKLDLLESPKGCLFRIKLPLIEIYSYSRNDKFLQGSPKRKRILVLDNEVQILNVLNTFIQEEGFVFIGSSHPVDALAFLRKASVDLIITDFHMPDMNGSQFIEEVRKNNYDGPILYMTSSKFIEQYNKDKNTLDIDGIIIKPFSKEDVLKTISSTLKVKGDKI